MPHIARDLVSASRRFRQKPAFFLGACALLALAVGGNTAVFTVVNAVILRPLPLEHERDLVAVHIARDGVSRFPLSLPFFLELRAAPNSFSGLAAYFPWSANLTDLGDAERLQAMRVTGNYCELLGVSVASGRPLATSDAAPDAAPVALISHSLWTRRFGGAPDTLGRSIKLNGEVFTVVGVLRPDFPFPVRDSDVIAPWAPERDPRRANAALGFLRVVGRLAPGAATTRAHDEVETRLRAFAVRYPRAGSADQKGRVVSLREDVVGNSDRLLGMLTAAVGLVMLIAAANLANLLLVNGAGRLHEFAARRALGATRQRLIAQLLTETLLLAVAGTVLGIIVARLAVSALLATSGNAIPRAVEVSVDPAATVFAVVLGLTIALLAALLPAMQLSRIRAIGAGAQRGVTRGGRMLRAWFVCAEVALSVLLVIGAGLLVRSFVAVQRVQPGFEPTGVLSLRLSLPRTRYTDTGSLATFYDALAVRVRNVPGVSAVAAANVVPMNGYLATSTIRPPGFEAHAVNTLPDAHYRMISPDYLTVMGIPLLNGRQFTSFDSASGMPVAIVSRGLARKYWHDDDPVGSQLLVRDDGEKFRTVHIVGVAGDVRHFGPEVESPSELYVPIPQVPDATSVWLANNMYWVARTGQNPLTIANAVRAEVTGVDPDVAASFVRSMDQWLEQSIHPRLFNVRIIVVFALTALLLAGVGVYGVAAETVALRTRELGVRAALGATDAQLKAAVMKGGLAPVAGGVVLGTAAALGLTSWLSSSLYGVEQHDGVTFVGVVTLISTVGVLALYIPARRVARIDPVIALRAE
jgi:predicted permease